MIYKCLMNEMQIEEGTNMRRTEQQRSEFQAGEEIRSDSGGGRK